MNQKDFFELANEMEAACGDWEQTEGLSEKTLQELISKVEALDAETSGQKPEEKVKPFRIKKRMLLVLAAALVLLLGMGVVGDRAWIAKNEDLTRDSEVTTKVDNEEKESILREEEEIYQEIAEKLGIAPMWLGHIPEGMMLDSYTIMEGTGWACINYMYNETLVSLQMLKYAEESSSNVQWDGESRELTGITNMHGLEDSITAYCIDEENNNYGASLKYGNGYYSISGFFEEKEFFEILDGIYFKNM